MRVEDLLIFGKSHCHSDHVKLLLADLLNLNPLELLNHLDEYVDEKSVELFKKEIISLKEGKPLQYVIGSVNFYGNKFIVNENVLIPRFETEELVENTIKYIKKHFEKPVRILDIGCGSGVIGLTLKEKLKEATVDLLDISEDALKVAKQNADNLNLSVNFIKSDVSTICVGMAASMAAFLLSSGEKGKRYILPNAEVMIHQPLGGAQGQATEIKIAAERILKLKKKLNKILSDNTGKDIDTIDNDTERDYFMDSDEALNYGIVDKVLKKAS